MSDGNKEQILFKFENKQALDSALLELCRVAPKNDPEMWTKLELLQDGGRLSLTVADGDLFMRISLESEGDAASVTVDPFELKRIIKKLPKKWTLAGAKAEEGLSCKAGKRASFVVEGTEDLYFEPGAATVWEEAQDFPRFNEAMKKVFFSASDEETRYYLNGVFLERSGVRLSCTATDGHRLSRFSQLFEVTTNSDDVSVIIPSSLVDAAQRLAKRYKDKKVSYALSKDSRRIRFIGSCWEVSSSLVDGSFPDYKQVIPNSEDSAVSFVFNRKELIEALDMAAVCSPEKTGGVRWTYDPSRYASGLILTSKTTGVSSFENKLKAEDIKESLSFMYESKEDENDFILDDDRFFEAGFNAKYWLEALKVSDCDSIRIYFSNALTPALMCPCSEVQGVSEEYVIMPMRL